MSIGARESTLYELLWDANVYYVPIYQRNYSWDKEQTSRLWETIYTAATDQQDYFLGSVVLVETGSQQILEVLDGQQRIATLLLLLAAFSKHLAASTDQPCQDANALIGRALRVVVNGTIPPGTPFQPGMQPHMHLNDQDHQFYADTISGASPEPRHSSHRLIKKAFAYFDAQIKAELRNGRWNSPSHFWDAIASALTQHLLYVRISVNNISTAQAVFESLNSAGLDLTKADLIKNYLLMNIPSHQHTLALAEWTNAANTLGETVDLTAYIRAFWNSAVEFVRTDRLYEELREVVVPNPSPTPSANPRTGKTPPFQMLPMKFLQELSADAEIQYRLAMPEMSFWSDSALCRDLEDLRDLGAMTVWVPLMAAYRATAGASATLRFADVVRQFLTLHVRYIVVGIGTANAVEQKYSEWAIRMRKDPAELPVIMDTIRNLIPADADFRNDMLRFTTKRLKTARVMLARINDQDAPKTGVGGGAAAPSVISQTIRDGSTVHVEHVIPQDATQWADFLKTEGLAHEDVVDELANLTLLLGARNISISNKPFDQKKVEYANASGDINYLLANASQFGAAELQARKDQLADWALITWPRP